MSYKCIIFIHCINKYALKFEELRNLYCLFIVNRVMKTGRVRWVGEIRIIYEIFVVIVAAAVVVVVGTTTLCVLSCSDFLPQSHSCAFSLQLPTHKFLKSFYTLAIRLVLGLPFFLFTSSFTSIVLFIISSFPFHVTCPAHLNIFILLVVFFNYVNIIK